MFVYTEPARLEKLSLLEEVMKDIDMIIQGIRKKREVEESFISKETHDLIKAALDLFNCSMLREKPIKGRGESLAVAINSFLNLSESAVEVIVRPVTDEKDEGALTKYNFFKVFDDDFVALNKPKEKRRYVKELNSLITYRTAISELHTLLSEGRRDAMIVVSKKQDTMIGKLENATRTVGGISTIDLLAFSLAQEK